VPLFGPPDISRLKARGDIDALGRALFHGSPGVEMDAVVALGELRATGPMINNLIWRCINAAGDEGYEWRKAATPEAVAHNDYVIGEIERSLIQAGAASVDPLVDLLAARHGWQGTPMTIVGLEMKFLPRQMPILAQRVALSVLAEVGDLRAAPVLFEMAREDTQWSSGGRSQLIDRALHGIGPSLIPVLLDRFVQADWRACGQLMGFGEEAMRAVLALTTHPDIYLRRRAVECLGAFGSAAAPYLSSFLTDSDTEIRDTAGAALARAGDPRGFPYLLEQMKRGRREALEPLKAMMVRLVKLMREADPEVRLAAADAIAQLGKYRSIKTLHERLQATAASPLTRLLKDKDPRVKDAAAAALEAIGRPAKE